MIDDDLQRKSVVGVNVFLLYDVSGPQQWSLQLKGWVGVVGSNDSVLSVVFFPLMPSFYPVFLLLR